MKTKQPMIRLQRMRLRTEIATNVTTEIAMIVVSRSLAIVISRTKNAMATTPVVAASKMSAGKTTIDLEIISATNALMIADKTNLTDRKDGLEMTRTATKTADPAATEVAAAVLRSLKRSKSRLR